MTERSVMMSLEHPYIVNLWFAFHTPMRLFFVMDFVNGGELFLALQQAGRFSEARTRIYAAEIAAALSYLHELEYLYRDLKPENVLIHEDGHLKLADFGLSKKVSTSEKTYTVVGSSFYMSPEVILRRGHGAPADWWSLGILVYEMLTGLPPFYDRNAQAAAKRLLAEDVAPTADMSPEAGSFMTGLLQRDPNRRLGTAPTPEQASSLVFEHPFLASIDQDLLATRSLPLDPEWIPALSGPLDLRHFDEVVTRRGVSDAELPDLSPKEQSAFDDFDFTIDSEEGSMRSALSSASG